MGSRPDAHPDPHPYLHGAARGGCDAPEGHQLRHQRTGPKLRAPAAAPVAIVAALAIGVEMDDAAIPHDREPCQLGTRGRRVRDPDATKVLVVHAVDVSVRLEER